MTIQRWLKIRDGMLIFWLDVLGVFLAIQLTGALVAFFGDQPTFPGFVEAIQGRTLSTICTIFLFFVGIEGLYTKRIPFWDEAWLISKGITQALGITMLVFYFSRFPLYFSFIRVVGLWIVLCFLVPLIRYFGKISLFRFGFFSENIVILGAGQSGKAVAEGIILNPYLGYRVLGFLDDDSAKIGNKVSIAGCTLRVFGKISQFPRFIRTLHLSTVVIAIPSLPPEFLARLTTRVQKFCRNILLIPDLKGIALMNTELHHMFDQQLFLLRINNNLLSLFNKLIKRAFDLAISISLLPVLFPLIAIIAILIKWETGSGAFFVQKRLGRGRILFDCIKFQTMHPNADEMLDEFFKKNPEKLKEWQDFKKIKGQDPRVTRIGSFLRRTSLDELPQIFNVLTGEMSLVGPRPYLPREEHEMKGYIETILLTTPGVTGLWQVRGRNELNFKGRMQLDVWYVLNWSLWADIEILFKTLLVVFGKRGAY